MLKSSKKSSKQSPFPVNSAPSVQTASPGSRASSVAAVEPQAIAVSKPMIKIPFGAGFTLMLEQRFLLLNFAALMLYIFAAFIANEWIYLLASGFFVANLLGFIVPYLQLWDVEASCSMPDEVLVSERADVMIGLKRVSRFGALTKVLPLQSIRMTVELLRRSGTAQDERVLSPDPVLIESIDGESWFKFPTASLKRGVYFMKSVELLSCFPFGTSWWIRRTPVQKQAGERRLTVHPLVVPIAGNFLYTIGGVQSLLGIASASSVVVNHSTSVRGVREFKVGDSLRHIHWASTAKTGRILVREFDSEVLPVFDLLLDLTANWRSSDQFETAILLMHSLAHLGYEMGALPQFTLFPSANSESLNKLLSDLPAEPPSIGQLSEILARVEPINIVNVSKEERTEEVIDELLTGRGDRPLLSVVPTSDSIAKFSPSKGDHVVFPVKLMLVEPGAYLRVERTAEPAKKESGKSAVKAKQPPPVPRDASLSMLLSQARQIASIDGEAEIAVL